MPCRNSKRMGLIQANATASQALALSGNGNLQIICKPMLVNGDKG